MKFKDSFFQNSYCRNGYLHRFNIELEFQDGVMEVCEICHLRKFFKAVGGIVDNADYMSWHIKQVLPYSHPYYERQHTDQLSNEIVSPYKNA